MYLVQNHIKHHTLKFASKGTARMDARFGIRRGRKEAKEQEQQSLESAATLTWGSFSHGVLEDIGGMEVQQFWRVRRQIHSEKLI